MKNKCKHNWTFAEITTLTEMVTVGNPNSMFSHHRIKTPYMVFYCTECQKVKKRKIK